MEENTKKPSDGLWQEFVRRRSERDPALAALASRINMREMVSQPLLGMYTLPQLLTDAVKGVPDPANPQAHWSEGERIAAAAANDIRDQTLADYGASETITRDPTTNRLVVDPVNAAAEVASMIIPSPATINKGVRLFGEATKAQRIGSTISDLAISPIVPLVQGNYKVWAPINAAVGAGAIAGSAALGNAALAAQQKENVFPEGFEKIDLSGGAFPAGYEPIDLGPTQPSTIPQLPVDDKEALDMAGFTDFDVSSAGEAAAAALAVAAGVGARALYQRRIGRLNEEARQAASQLANTRTEMPDKLAQAGLPIERSTTGPITDRATVAETQLVDRMAPITKAIEQTNLSDVDKATREAQLRTTFTPQAMASRLQYTMATGELPNSRIKTVPLANHMEELARLSPDELALYDDVLIAARRLDDVQAEGLAGWGHGQKFLTREQLQQIIARAPAGSRVARLVQEAQNFYRGLADYMVEAGLVDAVKRAEWATTKRNYVPIMKDFQDEGGGLWSFAREVEPGFEPNFLKQASAGKEGILPGEVQSIARSHEVYFSELIRMAEMNRVRRTLLSNFSKILDKNGDPVVVKRWQSYKPNDPMERIIKVRNAGKTEYWGVRDPMLAHAMEFRPQAANGYLNWARRFMQNMTTGAGNPLFAMTSMQYELWSAIALSKQGRGIGVLDALINDATGGAAKLSDVIPDPTVLATTITGTMSGIISRTMLNGARRLDTALRSSDTIVGLLGQQNIAVLRDVMMDAFKRSSYGLQMKFGGGNAVYFEAGTINKLPEALVKLAPNFARAFSGSAKDQIMASTAMRLYEGLLGAMHNSVRLGGVRASVARKHEIATIPLTIRGRTINVPILRSQPIANDAELLRIMADIRKMTGDMAQAPGDANTRFGRGYQTALVNNVPYYNNFVQVTAEHFRQFKKDPTQYIANQYLLAISVAGVLSYSFARDPEFAEMYWKDMTPEQRGRIIPIAALDGTGQMQSAINIDPYQRMYLSPLIEAIGTLYGYKNAPGMDTEESSIMRQAFEDGFEAFSDRLFRDVLPISSGPGVSAAVGAGTGALSLATQALGEKRTPVVDLPSNIDDRFSGTVQSFSRLETKDETLSNTVIEMAQATFRDLLGASFQPIFGMIEMGAIATGEGASSQAKLDAMAQRAFAPYREKQRLGPLAGIWGVDTRISTNDPIAEELQPRITAIENLAKQFSREVRAPGANTLSNEGEQLMYFNPNIRGTELAVIGAFIQPFNSMLTRYKTDLAELKRLQEEGRRVSMFADEALRRKREDDIAIRTREINASMLKIIQATERNIGIQLGRPFTFKELDRAKSAETPHP